MRIMRVLAFCAGLLAFHAVAAEPVVQPETWNAYDALGRTLPFCRNEADGKARICAMFYWSWHENFANHCKVYNTQDVLGKYPEAVNDFNHPGWGGTPVGTSYYWSEPLWGYYRSDDPFVIRKNAIMLANAGIDVIFFDCTNGTWTWKKSYEAIFAGFQAAMQEGVKVPKIAFMLNFVPNQNTVVELRQLYNDLYAPGLYKDLWFCMEGKPVIMAHPEGLDAKNETDKAIASFFCFKRNEPGYFAQDVPAGKSVWGWCSVFPQTRFGLGKDGSVEQMTVSIAQNASKYGLVAMNDYRGNVFGRGYAKDDWSPEFVCHGRKKTVNSAEKDSWKYGRNFQQQWNYAIKNDPQVVFITGWNEWIAGRFDNWQGSENAFPDEFSPEFSRDIEPCNAPDGDNFYYQLVAEVRKYKRLGKQPETCMRRSIDIKADETQWRDVLPEFASYRNDTPQRQHPGWAEQPDFSSPKQQNDIIMSKLAFDSKMLYFMARTAEDMTLPGTTPGWMRLYIDVDTTDLQPNWEGFQFVLKKWNPAKGTVDVECSTGGWKFKNVGKARFSCKGRLLQVAVPLKALNLSKRSMPGHIEFKWHDGALNDGDPRDFYTRGDAAPDGRFRFTARFAD